MGLCGSKAHQQDAAPPIMQGGAQRSPDDSPSKPVANSLTAHVKGGAKPLVADGVGPVTPVTSSSGRTSGSGMRAGVADAFGLAGSGADDGSGAASSTRSSAGTGARVSRTQPLTAGPRPDSPETMRITTRAAARAVKQRQPDGGIVTVWADDDPGPGTQPQAVRGAAAAQPRRAMNAVPEAPGQQAAADPGVGLFSPMAGLNHLDSVKATSPAIISFGAVAGGGRDSDAILRFEESLEQLAPTARSAVGGRAPAAPAPTDRNLGQSTQPGFRRGAPPVTSHEMVLSLSDDDDNDDDATGLLGGAAAGRTAFSMQRWKRHYHWNKNKPKDMLRFLWRHHDPREWTFYCITFKRQGSLYTAYQGENIIHGMACRIQGLLHAQGWWGGVNTVTIGAPTVTTAPTAVVSAAAAAAAAPGCSSSASSLRNSSGSCSGGPTDDPLFGLLHCLLDRATNSYKVVGVLLAAGLGPRPACLAGLHELSEWSVLRADVADPLVRTFVSSLITGHPPTPTCEILHTRELVW